MKMSGLILTNFYMIYRSLSIYTIGAIIIGAVLYVYMGDIDLFGTAVQLIAPRLMLLLSVLPVFEVLKIAAKSGYDKYVLTLPLQRGTIVKSQYLFLAFMTVLGLLVTIVALYIFSLLSWVSFDKVIFQELTSIFAIFFLTGSFLFPFIYLFGAAKSDIVVMLTFLASYGLAGLISKAGQYVGRLMGVDFLHISPTEFAVFGVIFLLISLLTYIFSYCISLAIYRKKEF